MSTDPPLVRLRISDASLVDQIAHFRTLTGDAAAKRVAALEREQEYRALTPHCARCGRSTSVDCHCCGICADRGVC